MYYLYRLYSPEGLFYIGMTKNPSGRLLKHLANKNQNEKKHLPVYSHIRQYFGDISMKIICCGDEELIRLMEMHNIKLHNPIRNSSLGPKLGSNRIGVMQFSRDGLLIKKWPSIRKAAKSLNLQDTNIVKCCRHKRRTTGGYIWKY